MIKRNRNHFLADFKRSQQAKQPAAAARPISEMTEAELEQEAARLRHELSRQELAAQRTASLGDVLRGRRRRRPYWK
jgi:hypothetical protein